MSMPNRIETRRGRAAWTAVLVALSALSFATSAPLDAQRAANQSTEDTRWLPWVGCWQRSVDPAANAQLTCVRPGTSSSADIMTITNGTVEVREHIVVDGQPHAIDRDGCTGSQTATWAASGNRIYIGAAYSCSGGLRGRSTRMFAILPPGIWLEIRDVHSGGGWVETVTRFYDAGLPRSVPADVRSEISRRELAIATSRAAASAPASTTDIAEAARSVDTTVVQSWLSARGQAFAADSLGRVSANTARVYYGSPTAPPPAPASAPTPGMLESGCDPFGCYAPNVYSMYNGTAFAPYARSYYGYGPSFYVPYAAPVVVIRGGGRVPRNGFSDGHLPWLRTPPVHTPLGHTGVGRSPAGGFPPRYTPSPSQPAGQAPRGGMPGRIRP